ncbi:MAG: VWA domain-containing protein [Candidatus Methanoperedenaceae archaeon]|nr:VWA domain-containing protein [Candidatus Methanoperedenaceae archaeon]
MSEVTSLLNSLKPELHIHAIASDRMDMLTFKDLKNKSSNLQEVETDGEQALKTFSPLMQDIWSGLYKYTPELRAPEEMTPSHALNRELVERMTQTQQYKELRLHTRLDDLHSAMATVTMSSNLAEKLKTELKGQADNANKMKDLEESISSESAKAMAYRDMALQCKENERAGLEEKAAASEKQAQSLKKQIPIMAHLIRKSREAAANKMRCAVRNAADEALEQADELSNTMDGWGIGQGNVRNLPIEDKIGLAKLLQTEKLKKMAQLLGRLRRLAIHKQKTKLIQARDEIHSVGRGDDISRLLPQELGLLRHPLAKKDFQKRFLEHDLAQYDLKGTERTGKGPIIVCVDNSGSMEGDREIWSKAVALALLEIATMQKRHYACIHFGSTVEALEITEIAPNDPDTFRKAVGIASYFLGGGTDFEKPLSASCELIKKSQYNKADIVFITDGAAIISPEFEKEFNSIKKQKEFRVTTVLINASQDENTEKFSDEIVEVSELIDAEAGQVFGI